MSYDVKTKHQHFLLSAKARTLSVLQVAKMSEQEAFETMKQLRWGKDDEITCPCCGSVNRHYFRRARKQWLCKDCNHTFSVTSGTIFAFHKLPLSMYLTAIALFVNAVKGISALQLSRDLGVQYKTACVLAHKIRESLFEQRSEEKLDGEIHVDGAYVNGSIRQQNKKSDRVDRRLLDNQKPDKRCVLVLRERDVQGRKIGGKRTLTFVLKKENHTDVKELVTKYTEQSSVICADEHTAYNPIHSIRHTRRVNHSLEYCADDGTTNNIAESFFSRFRRMQYGQVHHFGLDYLAAYANEAAYREDTRRMSNGDIFVDIVLKCLRTITHKDWCGYWQGNRRKRERLVDFSSRVVT